MRLGWALTGIALVVAAGGCTSDDAAPARWRAPSAAASAAGPASAGSVPAWTEPVSYGYELTRGCDAAAPLGRYRVAVRDGSVTRADRLDVAAAPAPSGADADLGPVTGRTGEEIDVPTLGELLTMARTASEDGGEVSAAVDPADGHPVRVVVDVSGGGPGGAECWTVSAYRPAG